MLGIRRGFLRRYSNFWKKTYRSAHFSMLSEKHGQLFNIFLRKNGSFFWSALPSWADWKKDVTLISSTQHLQLCLKGKWVLLYVILFPHFWYHKKICSSVAHHYLCILKIHQKDLRWRGRSLSQCLSSESLCETRHWCMRKSCWWSW